MTERVVVSSYLLSRSVTIGEPFERNIKIDNQTSRYLPSSRLFLDDSTYNSVSSVQVPDIQPFQSKTVTIKYNIKGGITIDSLPSFDIVAYNGTKYKFSSSMMDFTRYFYEIRPPSTEIPKLNILLFGLAGATKSSFLNSIFTLLNRDNPTSIITRTGAGGAAHHNTTTLAKFELEYTNIVLWDTWGLTQKNYDGGELEYILQGLLPSKWEMNYKIAEEIEAINANNTSKSQRRIHCVLFFIPQAVLNDPNQGNTRKLISENFELISKKGYNPLLLLTRVDEFNTKIRAAPNDNYPEVQELRRNAANLLNIAERRVFYNLNYISESTRNFEIDKLNYKILEEATKCAQEYIKSPSFSLNSSTTAKQVRNFVW